MLGPGSSTGGVEQLDALCHKRRVSDQNIRLLALRPKTSSSDTVALARAREEKAGLWPWEEGAGHSRGLHQHVNFRF